MNNVKNNKYILQKNEVGTSIKVHENTSIKVHENTDQ